MNEDISNTGPENGDNANPSDSVTDWRASLSEENQGKYSEFKSVDDLLNGYDSLSQKFSSKTEDLKEEVAREHKESLGIPDAADKYDFGYAEDHPVDKEMLGAFSEAAHNAGLSNDQAKAMTSFFDQYMGEAIEAHKESVRKDLKDEWLNDYDKNLETIENFRDTLPEGIKKTFEDPKYGNDPAIIKLMHHLAT
ncbi:MAG: hypothetical protein MK137_06050, partial [Rickettsiales bacterium]|nr:hypothetical protein [Rickettsiales bacterium]